MNRHPTDEEILDLLRPGAEPGPEIREHLETCGECRARLDAERPLSERLAGLADELDPPRDPWPDVREAIARSDRPAVPNRRWVLPALRAAAAVAIFVLGGAAGRAFQPERAGDSFDPDDPLAAAVAVQRAGTDYVAAVARFRSIAASSSPGAVDQARDVALAAVHGAAWELTRMRPEDATARGIVALASGRRVAAEAP